MKHVPWSVEDFSALVVSNEKEHLDWDEGQHLGMPEWRSEGLLFLCLANSLCSCTFHWLQERKGNYVGKGIDLRYESRGKHLSLLPLLVHSKPSDLHHVAPSICACTVHHTAALMPLCCIILITPPWPLLVSMSNAFSEQSLLILQDWVSFPLQWRFPQYALCIPWYNCFPLCVLWLFIVCLHKGTRWAVVREKVLWTFPEIPVKSRIEKRYLIHIWWRMNESSAQPWLPNT